MTLPAPPNITAGQIALDPVNGIVYYVDDNGDKVATTWSWLQSQSNEINISSNKNVSIGQDLTVSGDLIIQGDTVSLNVSEVLVEDNILILNSNYTGAPSLNAGIEVERGSETNVQIRWNESTDTWQYTNDGTTFYDINSITPNSIQLGYHTTGSYVATVSAGTGISVTTSAGEGSTPQISLNATLDNLSDVVISTATPNQILQFVGGNWTNQTLAEISNLNDLSDVVISDPQEFQLLEYNGTSWVNSHASSSIYVRNADSVTLTTGTVVYLFGATGDHATVKRADNDSDTTSSKTVGVVSQSIAPNEHGVVVSQGYVDGIDLSVGYTSGDTLWLGEDGAFTKIKPTAPEHLVFVGVVVRATNNGIIYVSTQNGYELDELHNVSLPSPVSGQFLKYDGSLWVADAIDLTTDTTGDYVAKLAAGSGISITNNSGEGSTPNISWSATLDDVSNVTAPSPSSGDYLKWNGSAWINDPINLGTDTTGNYMTNVSAGTGISVSHTQGEGSTATVSLSAGLDDLTDVVIAGIPTTNHVLLYNGSAWVSGAAPGGLSSASPTSEGVVYGKTSLSGGTVFLGYNSGNTSVSGSNNIAIGEYSQSGIMMGAGNVAIGYGCLRNNTSNNYSVAIGYTALEYAIGGYNIGIGYNTLRGNLSLSSGGFNIAIGQSAGYGLGTGSYNIFMGSSSGYGITSSSYNIGIGSNTLKNVQGNANVAIGDNALNCANGTTSLTGIENIAIGANAGSSQQSGSYNIFLGRGAGAYNTSGSRNVFIGYSAGDVEYGSDKLYIANSNTSSPLIKGDFASSTVEINGSLAYRQAFNNQGINTMVYLTSSDKGKVVTFNTSSNVTVYVNNFANLVAGERIDLLNLGTGTVTISGSGVTINGTPGLKLRAQYSAGSLLCLSNNSTYVLIGDLAA